jgi:hypothetical protein
VIGAGGNVLQWSLASAAAVPAAGSTIGADDDGDTVGADADAEAGEAANEDGGAELDTGAGDESETTPDDSAALRPCVDPLPHPTTMIPTITAQDAARRAAFIRPPRWCR